MLFHDYEINMCEKFIISMTDHVQLTAGKTGVILITNICIRIQCVLINKEILLYYKLRPN